MKKDKYQKFAELQERLKKKVKIIPIPRKVRYIGGADVSYSRALNKMVAVIVVFELEPLKFIAYSHVVEEVREPYVPTFLSFRELPALENAYRKLKVKPDVTIVDGQGIAHPRGLGIASHFGITFEIPTIGCAKSRLVGEYTMPGPKRGDFSWLYYEGKKIGIVLRTKDNVRPIFVSPGHLVDFKDALEITLKVTTKYRLPEPIRYADHLSRKLIRLEELKHVTT